MTSDQMITILIGILPNSIVDYIITKHDIMKDDYDDVEDTMYDYLARIEIKDETKKQSPLGAIGSVGSDVPASETQVGITVWRSMTPIGICGFAPRPKGLRKEHVQKMHRIQRSQANPLQKQVLAAKVMRRPRGKAKAKARAKVKGLKVDATSVAETTMCESAQRGRANQKVKVKPGPQFRRIHGTVGTQVHPPVHGRGGGQGWLEKEGRR